MKACRVLIIEDDPLIGMLLADSLVNMGYGVCAIAATAADGVAAAAQYRPDLVIADVRLGDGSGISAIDEILRTGFVPHFFMTGNVLKVKVLRPNAVVLEKPFDTAKLMLAIQSVLDIAPTSSRTEC